MDSSLEKIWGGWVSVGHCTLMSFETIENLINTWHNDPALWREANSELPACDANAKEIRTFLNDPANEKVLAQGRMLKLDNQDLKLIPPEINRFSQLKVLVITSNKLAQISDFPYFPNLIYLSWENNQLRSFPESIENLSSLEFLKLDNNQIDSLPEASESLNLPKGLLVIPNVIQE
jgi:Leucine-rich repeat (LRR) protein